MTLADRYSPATIEWTLRQAPPNPSLPTLEDRDAWEAARARMGDDAAALRAAADAAAAEQAPPAPATLFLDFAREGRRDRYQAHVDAHRERLRDLVLATCLFDETRWADAILDLVWAICEESDWCRPAHQPDLADVRRPFVDLTAGMTALQLAEADHLLGERLHPAARHRIRVEIDRRCFAPYLARHDFHWMFTTPEHGVNNWAAVIAAGVLGAACYLEDDRTRLAELLHRGLRSLDDYRAGFDVDGGTSEGSFCWAYGFGYYTILAELIERRTGGRVDLWDERARTIATVPLRTYLGPRRFVNFSDCPIHFTHIAAQLAYLARRLEEPALGSVAAVQPPNPRERLLSWGARALFWQPPEPRAAFEPRRFDDFRGLQWMVARLDPSDPDALTLAVKGGHNAEMHNQNDVGNLTVDVCGEPLLVDLGKGGFDRAYFQHRGGRYDFLVNASRGHSVPRPNGVEQAYGAAYAARVLHWTHDEDGDRLVLDLTRAYPAEADLESLQRTVRLDRRAGIVTVEDEVSFRREAGRFESAWITLAEVECSGGGVRLRGARGALRLVPDAPGLEVEVEEIPGLILEGAPVLVRRVTFTHAEAIRDGRLGLRIEPEACR